MLAVAVFVLTEEMIFPNPSLANKDGLLAVGGDLQPARLLLAYQKGIFPWYSEGEPILWWSSDPRLVLYPNEIRISRSLKRTLNKKRFRSTFDHDFNQVIHACAHSGQRAVRGTWITPEMMTAYRTLHTLGCAHSVETWHGEELVGGLYGVSLGGCFFGESMFSKMADASKVALVFLADQLCRWRFQLIDCQMPSDHLIRMGARLIPRHLFLSQLHESQSQLTKRESWAVYGEHFGEKCS